MPIKNRQTREILYLGRFDPMKGCLELLEAFRMIHAKQPEAQLVMAGNGRNWEAARQFVADNHLEQSVALPGWIEGVGKRAFAGRSQHPGIALFG